MGKKTPEKHRKKTIEKSTRKKIPAPSAPFLDHHLKLIGAARVFFAFETDFVVQNDGFKGKD